MFQYVLHRIYAIFWLTFGQDEETLARLAKHSWRRPNHILVLKSLRPAPRKDAGGKASEQGILDDMAAAFNVGLAVDLHITLYIFASAVEKCGKARQNTRAIDPPISYYLGALELVGERQIGPRWEPKLEVERGNL